MILVSDLDFVALDNEHILRNIIRHEIRSIPTCFQVFVSIPATQRKSWNSCELSAIGNILDCQYKTLGDAQAAGRMPRAHACTTPTTPFPILET